MKTEQLIFKSIDGNFEEETRNFSFNPELILIFGSPLMLNNSGIVENFRNEYPDAIITGCSTAGEIGDINVYDNSLVATAVKFNNTKIVYNSIHIDAVADSRKAGKELIEKFDFNALQHIFVLSDGLNVNGSELVAGIREALPRKVNVTGGLAGDGADFNNTYVIGNNKLAQSKIVTALGFYGDKIKVSYGSLGGWDSFGIERQVTKSEANVLYEIDNMPALELYESFLGDKAKDLPASGLLFPLSLRTSYDEEPVVRTILAIDKEAQSLTFAGDLPEGSSVKFMKANVDRLINGAEDAANISLVPLKGADVELAILISCVGRKLVLKQMVEEEVEAVKDVFGGPVTIAGFYSYGEIAPFLKDAVCELHNQTMTITTFTEIE
ncbi:MAG: FIST N-terminal domain-containing protein [Bacteroidota bacterium]